MKTILFFFALAISTLSYAQDSTKIKVDTPKIVNKLQYGKSVSVNNIEVKFIELISDSRCPQGVSCVWAGEVAVLVDVLENGKKIDSKKLIFNSLGKANDIYISDGINISGVNISPYPVYGKQIALEDYKMQLYIKN